jgi:hypothetical protein
MASGDMWFNILILVGAAPRDAAGLEVLPFQS